MHPILIQTTLRAIAILSWLIGFTGLSAAAGTAEQVVGDIACDGRLDAARFVVRKDSVVVEVKFGDASRQPQTLKFGVGDAAQDSFCSAPMKLSLESQDFDPQSAGANPLPGFHRSSVCQGLVLEDAKCDPIHVYWNHDEHRLGWWRL